MKAILALINNKPRAILFAILSVSLALKLGVLVWVNYSNPSLFFMKQDPKEYHACARALLHTGNFSKAPERPDQYETRRTPGYPVFLAGVYAIFGEQPAAGSFVQILLSTGTIALVYYIACRLWQRGIALLAALLLALDIQSFSYSLPLLSETVFTFLIIATLAAYTHLIQTNGKAAWAFAVGALLGLAIMVRPIGYFLVFVVVFVILLSGWTRHWRGLTLLTVLLLIVLPYSFLIGGWQVRNYRLTGQFFFTRLEGIHMRWLANAAFGKPLDENKKQKADNSQSGRSQQSSPPSSSQEEESMRLKQEGMVLLREHPLAFVRFVMSKIPYVMIPAEQGMFLRLLGFKTNETKGPLLDLTRLPLEEYMRDWIIGQPVYFFVFILAISLLLINYFGLLCWIWSAVSTRRISVEHVFFWAAMLYFICIAAGLAPIPRFRVPVMPIISLYAAAGLAQFLKKLPSQT